MHIFFGGFFDNMEMKEATMRDMEAHEVIQKKYLEENTTLLGVVSKKVKVGPL